LKRADRGHLSPITFSAFCRGAAINVSRSRYRHLLRRGKSLHREREMSLRRNSGAFNERIHNYLMRDKGLLGTAALTK